MKDEIEIEEDDDHRLTNFVRGESEVETLTYRIEQRRRERITVMNVVRLRFVKTCRSIAKESDHAVYKIQISMLKQFRDDVKIESEKTHFWTDFKENLGFRSQSKQLLDLLEMGITIAERQDGVYFHYMDFNYYYVQTESRWPWMRSGTTMAVLSMLFFYTFSPVFFCYIFPDPGICPNDPTHQNRPYYGFVSALYFVSTTLSTVGYGDLGVSTDSNVRLFIGVLYMILSNVMLIVAFSAAADSSTSIFTRINNIILQWIWGDNDSELLYKKVRRVMFLRIGQIVLTFVLLNLIGVIVSRVFMGTRQQEESGEYWTWMTSIYWAVQTTTTIGYGDLDMGFSLRWFQIFYLILSTYFVGNTLGGLAALKDELHEILSYTAWNRREVSKGLIDELQPYEHDGKIDQYEFVVGSLVTLGKINYGDVAEIMDKFRILANLETGFVEYEEDETELAILAEKAALDAEIALLEGDEGGEIGEISSNSTKKVPESAEQQSLVEHQDQIIYPKDSGESSCSESPAMFG